jgi:hypothetical protein
MRHNLKPGSNIKDVKFVVIICSITSNLLLKGKWTLEEDIGRERVLASKSLF